MQRFHDWNERILDTHDSSVPAPFRAHSIDSNDDAEPGESGQLLVDASGFVRLVESQASLQSLCGRHRTRACGSATCDTLHVDPEEQTLRMLLDRCRNDHLAWINGDGAPYVLPSDGSIMGAVGGHSRGGPQTLERQIAVAKQWVHGEGSVEFVNGSVDGDVAWLAIIERASVMIRGEVATRRWDVRATEVFRRTAEGWIRIHRHADPLVDRHQLAPLFALLENPAR